MRKEEKVRMSGSESEDEGGGSGSGPQSSPSSAAPIEPSNSANPGSSGS